VQWSDEGVKCIFVIRNDCGKNAVLDQHGYITSQYNFVAEAVGIFALAIAGPTREQYSNMEHEKTITSVAKSGLW